MASCASSPTTVLTPEDDKAASTDQNEHSGKECKPTIASEGSSDEIRMRKRTEKPPSDGGKGGKRPRKRAVESDSNDDSEAQVAAGVSIKEVEEVSSIEKIIALTMDEESISTEDSDAGERPTPPPVLLRTRGPCLPARPVVESAMPIAVA